jgi:ubiquinone/menaquinone biosynthesis C-methylase UbiE
MRLPKTRLFDLFYRVYHAWPRFYSGVTQLMSIGQWERWQDRVFDDLSGNRILEIGVGQGNLLIRMAKRGYSVTGIEISRGMAYEARRRVKHAGYDVDILLASTKKLPFRDATFDCIVATFVLAEIGDLDAATAEWKRILKKGGKMIVVAGGIPQDRNIIATILFKIIEPHTVLRIERNNVSVFTSHGFSVTRQDFGPFNIIHKIVAIKP